MLLETVYNILKYGEYVDKKLEEKLTELMKLKVIYILKFINFGVSKNGRVNKA